MYAAEIILVRLGGNRVDDLYRLVSNVVEEGSRGNGMERYRSLVYRRMV